MSYNISGRDKRHGCQCCMPKEVEALIASYPKLLEAINNANEAAAAAREAVASFPDETTNKEIEQLFNGEMVDEDYMWLPSMDMDSEGYVALNIDIDNEGWAHFVDELKN